MIKFKKHRFTNKIKFVKLKARIIGSLIIPSLGVNLPVTSWKVDQFALVNAESLIQNPGC